MTIALEKSVDVGSELGEIRAAIESASLLVDLLTEGAGDWETAERLPRCLSGLLYVTICRLHHVERACNGGRDPAEILTSRNRVLGPDGLHMKTWSPRQRLQEGQRQVRRLALKQPSTTRRSRK